MACNIVRGTVVEEGAHTPIPDATVLLSFVRGRRRTVVGTTTTDSSGVFVLDVAAGRRKFDLTGGPGRMELSVQQDGTELDVVGGTWRWFASTSPGEVTLCVTVPDACTLDPAGPPGSGDIVGRVLHHDGTPAVGVQVSAHDVQMTGVSAALQLSGSVFFVTTDSAGWYALTFSPSLPASPQPNLLVEVVAPGSPDRLIGTSAPQYGESIPNLRIDVDVCDAAFRSATEWSLTDTPLATEKGATPFEDLTGHQLAFLAGRTGLALERVERWASSHVLASRLNLSDPDAPEALYGLRYAGLSMEPRALHSVGSTRIKAALDIAYSDNVIGEDASLLFDALSAGVLAWRAAHIGDPANTHSLHALFSSSGVLTATQVNDVVDAYLNHADAQPSFWDYVGDLSSMTPSAVAEAQRLVVLASIAHSHAPSVAAITSAISHGPAEDAATLAASAWSTLVGTIAEADLPPFVDGDDAAERRANWASQLQDNALAAWPSTAAGAALRADSSMGGAYAFATAAGNEAFDFGTDNVLEKDEFDAYIWAATDESERQEAARFQRLMKSSPSSTAYNTAKAAFDLGLTSAGQITSKGPKRAIAALTGAGVSALDARFMVAQAGQAASKALTVYTRAHPSLLGVGIGGTGWPDGAGYLSRFLPAEDVDTAGIPTWEDLFGNVDFCGCEDCRSIGGPAAYFADLLHWLEDRDGWTGALRDRRPDLGEMMLNCANTTRSLPYIDLALEVMETEAAGLLSVTPLSTPTTDALEPDLLDGPQYVNHAVYDALASEAYPITLPFDRSHAETQVFLGHLGVRRSDLMRAMQTVDGVTPSSSAIALEDMDLSAGSAGEITATGGNERDRWGIAVADWPADIRVVETFLERAEVTYDQLLDLLHSRFINPTAGTVHLTYTDACDLDTYSLDGAASWDATFEAFRQLVRLQRATGWSVLELDRVLDALSVASTVTTSHLDDLGPFVRLARERSVCPSELAAWFSDMDIWDDRDTRDPQVPSLYEAVYLNASILPIHDRTDNTTVAWKLSLTSGEPNGVAEDLSGYAAEVQALLGVDAASLEFITGLLSTTPKLTLANLSHCYRWVSLSRVAGLSAQDCVAFVDLTGIDPFFSPGNAQAFLDHADQLRESGLTVAAVRYLVSHDDDAVASLGPSESWLQGVIGRLGDKVSAHFGQEPGPVSDPDLSLLTTVLDGILVDPDTVSHPVETTFSVDRATLDSAIAGTLDDTSLPPEAATYQEYLQLVFEAALEGWADTADFTTQLAALTAKLDSTSNSSEIALRQLWALQRLVQWQAGEAVVVDHFASELGLPASLLSALRQAMFELLNGGITDTPSGTVLDWADLWLLPTFRDGGYTAADLDALDPATLPEHFGLVEVLSKLGYVVQQLGITGDEASWWVPACETALASPWELWDAFQVVATAVTGASATTSYEGLKRLADVARLRYRMPGSSPSLAELLSAVDAWDASAISAFCTAVASRTGWLEDDVSSLATTLDLVSTSSGDRATMLHRLVDAVDIIRRVGAGASVVASWRGTVTSTVSNQVVMAARARYETAEAWSAVARPIRDQLRKRQRDALVAYLVANSGSAIMDADDLYAKLLIDVQVNPEVLTSRLKQGTASAQLYVQRNLFGLETEVAFNEDDREQWKWMKNYRVWEAARKVFLYPENWIEPELRDDKSPFFRALENEVSQGDITDERVEEATLAYLDRLREVAQLRVVAHYAQREEIVDESGDPEETTDVLHVFARSASQPPTYWYRRWEDQSTWTPWEEVKGGVEGWHLVPVVYQRRLMLFWLVLNETSAEDEDADPSRWYELRLCWSEYRDGKWQPKQEAAETLSLEDVWAGSTNSSGVRRVGSWHERYFRFLSSETEEGDLLIRGIVWHPKTLKWYEIGGFTVDGCTGLVDADPTVNEAETEYEAGTYYVAKWTEDEVVEADAEGLAEDEWSAWTPTKRDKVIGSGSWGSVDWSDLEEAEKQAVYAYLSRIYPESFYLVDDKQIPNVADLLARVDAKYWAPGFSESNDYVGKKSGGARLKIFLGDWSSSDLQPVEDGEEVTLLETIFSSRAVLPTQFDRYVSQAPFFLQTEERCYFVVKEADTSSQVAASALDSLQVLDTAAGFAVSVGMDAQSSETSGLSAHRSKSNPGLYRFDNFFHPYVCRFVREARRGGLPALLAPSETGSAGELNRQQLQGDEYFESSYLPTEWVKPVYPLDDIDFSESGSYSLYNWELFFHLPFYVGSRLMENQRFEEALQWYSYVFDPLDRGENATWSDPPTRFWKIKPFLDPVTDPVTDWIAFSGADGDADQADAFERQVEAWRDDPFNPHLLARMRAGTYQKAIVMRYIENLIRWGDNLFTRDTIESINEATQLYVLAGQVLGDPPQKLTKPTAVTDKSFDTLLSEGLDVFSSGVVTSPVVFLESLLKVGSFDPFSSSRVGRFTLKGKDALPRVGGDTYFCVPPNARLLGYWDTVADRLFKIRNSLNIQGVFRTLPLYQPPIDSAMLVRARAQGVDVGTVLADLDVPLPNHRFSVLSQRAQALASSVRALGGALLSALEKRDAEALALLRQSHELTVRGMVQESREKAVEEARESRAALQRQRAVVVARRDYYKKLIAKGWLGSEKASSALQQQATVTQSIAASINAIGGIFGAFPDVFAGTGAGATTGGDQFARAMGGVASAVSTVAAIESGASAFLSTVSAYTRRAQEWKNQQRLAVAEIAAIDKQLAASEIRIAIAQHDVKTVQTQVRQAEELRTFMETRFTNQELYDWMVGQVSATYYQSYQLAYQLAKQAQRAYNHELGRSDSLLTGAFWDNTRKGLLAGERLQHDLERLDAAYLDNDVREHEMTKHISLQLLDPLAMEALKKDGECFFQLPQELFDLDCATHYFRRIQSVALSVACVAGPQGMVNLKLTLHNSSTLRTATSTSVTADGLNDAPSIVTSTALNDAGLFQTDLRDPRYLPFERRGVISTWQLEIVSSSDLKQFDWSTIEDVTLHMRYTARDGRPAASIDLENLGIGYASALASKTDGGFVRLLSARRDEPEGLVVAQDGGHGVVDFTITADQIDPAGAETLAAIYVVPVLAEGATAASSAVCAIDNEDYAAGSLGGVEYFGEVTTLPSLPSTISVELGDGSNRLDSVLGRLADPPASPSSGDRYLVVATATGAWAGQEGKIAEYTTSWSFTAPASGDLVLVEDESLHYAYTTSWAAASWNFSQLADVVLILLYT